MTKQELATKIWATANVLRKNIKASEYKDYILGFMFYKYLSDREIEFIEDEGGTKEDLQDMTATDDFDYLRDNLGYFVAYDDLFSSWQTLGQKLGAQTVTAAIERFYQSLSEKSARVFYVYNQDVDRHSGVFNALDAGLSKLGENIGSRDKAIRDIIGLVAQIPTRSQSYDVLGYIYEYLIQQFSSEAKKDGAFYTPHELTSLMARIIAERLKDRGSKYIQVYDPCVGTAGLLLSIGKEIGKYHDKHYIKYYGQELITETSNLAKMNLFMKKIPVENLILRNADTLDEDWPIDPENACGPLSVDAVTANPPYSAHWDPELHTSDERFRQYGLAPSTKADLAFLLHCLYHIKPDGIVAIVLPHGVLSRSGAAEEEIRKNLIENNNIETIIGLPSNLFFATPISVIIMVLSKNRAKSDVLFIDASQAFQKNKAQNVLLESDVQRIYDAVIARRDIPHFARLVSKEQIVAEDYNLNIPRYISATQEEAPYDLYALMTGDIAKDELDSFADFWQQFPQLRSKLLTADGSYSRFITEDIADVVHADEGVVSLQSDFQKQCQGFHTYLIHTLIDSPTDERTHDKIAATLFQTFRQSALVDVYDIYQAFSGHWDDIETDLIRIHDEGREICRQIEPDIVLKKNAKTKRYEEVMVGMRGKVIPLGLIKKTYFPEDLAKIQELLRKADDAASTIQDIFENLSDDAKEAIVKDDDDTKYELKKLKAAIKSPVDLTADDLAALRQLLHEIDTEKAYKKKAKTAAAELEKKTEAKAQSLTDAEVHDMFEKTWVTPVTDAIQSVMQRVIEDFIHALKDLKQKYANPLSELDKQEQEESAKLKALMSELTGSDTDVKALKMLMEEL
ncbi:type I restriction-modification system subunit M [uncultured Selenomonas sp.]|uniref:type I restriction-modification system subunit M n=1 Tax=uncultured Selenomonas sp. TaxID=159275 RepID=UPI002803DDC2|nr:type I restriction-modification system subunit M [uncultured Selenomonas sp.]